MGSVEKIDETDINCVEYLNSMNNGQQTLRTSRGTDMETKGGGFAQINDEIAEKVKEYYMHVRIFSHSDKQLREGLAGI